LESAGRFSEAELLRLLSGLEKGSEHPLAAAFVRAAAERGITPAGVREFRSFTGKGVLGYVDGHAVILGTAALLADYQVGAASAAERAEALRREGQTVLLAAVDGRFAGLAGVADPIRSTTPEALKELHAEGLRVLMLTGDNRLTAEAVGKQIGVDEVFADLVPAEKAAVVARLQAEGRVVAGAGDGINDAPALAKANAGLAMGTGTGLGMGRASVR